MEVTIIQIICTVSPPPLKPLPSTSDWLKTLFIFQKKKKTLTYGLSIEILAYYQEQNIKVNILGSVWMSEGWFIAWSTLFHIRRQLWKMKVKEIHEIKKKKKIDMGKNKRKNLKEGRCQSKLGNNPYWVDLLQSDAIWTALLVNLILFPFNFEIQQKQCKLGKINI